jgi:hypothetical protein
MRANLAATFGKFLHSQDLSEKNTNHGRRVTFPRPRIKQRPEKDFRHFKGIAEAGGIS